MNGPFLKTVRVAPRLHVVLSDIGDGADATKISEIVHAAWGALLVAMERPIQCSETDASRDITVLGALSFRVEKETGQISLFYQYCKDDCTVGWTDASYRFNVALPLYPNGKFMEHFVAPWFPQIVSACPQPVDPGFARQLAARIDDELWRALRRSSHWKRLRKAVREALALDPDVLRWARAGYPRHLNHNVCNLRYNYTQRLRSQYESIERDNPRLVWLNTLLLDDGVVLPGGEPVATMKRFLRRHGLSEAGWKRLCNGHEHDFRIVRDHIGPRGDFDKRYAELGPWCQVLIRLEQQVRLPRRLQALFLHDGFAVRSNGTVRFRKCWIPVGVLKSIVREAHARLDQGQIKEFESGDLAEVTAWLGAERPTFDRHQIRAGWPYLLKRTQAWRQEVAARATLGQLSWRSDLSTAEVLGFTVVPLTDAWALRKEALSRHHCADRYLEEALIGNKRLFSVHTAKGRPIATLGLERDGRSWQVFCFRGACNQPISAQLVPIGPLIAQRYTDVWRLTHPESRGFDVPDDPDFCDWYADSEDAQCAVCGTANVVCGKHLVACFDLFDDNVFDGAVRKRWRALCGLTERIIQVAIEHDLPSIGLGKRLDNVLTSVRRSLAHGDELEDAFSEWRSGVQQGLLTLLSTAQGVRATSSDFDGGMPGNSTTYWAFYSEAPETTVNELESLLQGYLATLGLPEHERVDVEASVSLIPDASSGINPTPTTGSGERS